MTAPSPTPWHIAERAILSAILRQPDLMDVLELRAEHFSAQQVGGREVEVHGAIYGTALALHQGGQTVTPATVQVGLAMALLGEDLLERVVRYVDALHAVQAQTTAEEMADHAKTVRDYAGVRYARAQWESIGQLLEHNDVRALDTLSELAVAVKTGLVMDARVPWDPRTADTMEVMEAMAQGDVPTGVPTGFPSLDKQRLLAAGDYVVLGGFTSIGKSAFALRVAAAAAAADVPVLYVSMEMSGRALARRMLSSQARVSHSKMRTGGLDSDDWGKLNEERRREQHWPLFVMDTGERNVATIRMRALREQAADGLGLIVVDYAQRLHPSPQQSRLQLRERMIDISSRMKDLAMDLNVPVLCLSQLGALADNDERRPRLTDLSESGSYYKDADSVWLLSRRLEAGMTRQQWEKEPARPLWLDVAKSREGIVGDIEVLYLADYVLFAEATKLHVA